MVGQICREGMDESGILPKARCAMTVFHLPGVAGCLGVLYIYIYIYISPVDPGQSPGGVQGAKPPEAPAILQYTVLKNAPQKHFLGTFLSVCCIQIERKNSFN